MFASRVGRLSCPVCPQALYLSWVVEARRNILAILQDMPSLRPPIDHLCELLPRLQARYYSIASSSKVGVLPAGNVAAEGPLQLQLPSAGVWAWGASLGDICCERGRVSDLRAWSYPSFHRVCGESHAAASCAITLPAALLLFAPLPGKVAF